MYFMLDHYSKNTNSIFCYIHLANLKYNKQVLEKIA